MLNCRLYSHKTLSHLLDFDIFVRFVAIAWKVDLMFGAVSPPRQGHFADAVRF